MQRMTDAFGFEAGAFMNYTMMDASPRTKPLTEACCSCRR
jgi:hypothetical protein